MNQDGSIFSHASAAAASKYTKQGLDLDLEHLQRRIIGGNSAACIIDHYVLDTIWQNESEQMTTARFSGQEGGLIGRTFAPTENQMTSGPVHPRKLGRSNYGIYR